MELVIALTFILGYLAIVFEHQIRVNKAASALLTGTICWTIYILCQPEKELVTQQLMEHLGNVSGILFFLLGAMTIVELIDAHDGFQIITDRIKTRNVVKLLWLVGIITFFLSAVLDNLTTTIVIVSLLRKIIEDKKMRLFFVGITVIAANAGGAWSPMGDVTTTMLWIGGQVSATGIMSEVFLASVFCLVVPLIYVSFKLKGNIAPMEKREETVNSTALSGTLFLASGSAPCCLYPFLKRSPTCRRLWPSFSD